MENVIYKTTIIPYKAAKDGETPTVLYLTEEQNGLAILIDGYDGTELVEWYPKYLREKAIERAVDIGRARMAAKSAA